jgi:tetratricopeptide (TPR) repeat protein
MTAAVDHLRRGLAAHEAGKLAEAEALYASVLERDPADADAWHLLGRIALTCGQADTASARVLRAIRRRPDIAPFHCTLGEILAAQGRHSEAGLCYREALRLDPGFVPALVNLGNALQNQGLYRDACVAYWRALERQPDCAEAFSNLGNALRSEGRTQDALDCYMEAWRIRPDAPEVCVNVSAAWLILREFAKAEEWARRGLAIDETLVPALSNLSLALLNQGRLEEAEVSARSAIGLSPGAPHLLSNLGSVLLHAGRFEEAETALRHALELRPDYAEAANNLGVLLRKRDLLEEAGQVFAELLRRHPNYPEAWTNLGSTLQLENRHSEAIACFDQAIGIDAENAKAHFCRGLSRLSIGDLDRGFADYEWRRQVSVSSHIPHAPEWDGSDLQGKRILLFAEQGLGDTIQFARFVPAIAAKGGQVFIACQPALVPLLGRMAGVCGAFATGATPQEFDCEAPLLSVPRFLGIGIKTVPCEVPYLSAGRAGVARMESLLGHRSGLRVGLAWSGNPQNASDHLRSVRIEDLSPLRSVSGVEWHSLHTGRNAEQAIARAGNWIRQTLSDTGGLEELAALMECLDLIVSVDTMAAHLAGALARPVWTMLCYAPDWRWGVAGTANVWYPSMTLYRQAQRGCWDAVTERIAGDLAKCAQAIQTPDDMDQ